MWLIYCAVSAKQRFCSMSPTVEFLLSQWCTSNVLIMHQGIVSRAEAVNAVECYLWEWFASTLSDHRPPLVWESIRIRMHQTAFSGQALPGPTGGAYRGFQCFALFDIACGESTGTVAWRKCCLYVYLMPPCKWKWNWRLLLFVGFWQIFFAEIKY